MNRFNILFKTALKTWLHDPISTLGGFIAPVVMITAFFLLFGGHQSFTAAVIDHDQGGYGQAVSESFTEVFSPFGVPYYQLADMPDDEIWAAYEDHKLDVVWVIPDSFSERIEKGLAPQIAIYMNNYHDDSAKNHRIYAAEILWHFYEKTGFSGPPVEIAEEFAQTEIVGWFSIIAVAIVLLGFTLGGMMNIFMLTYKEKLTGILLEFSLAPKKLAPLLLPKMIFALLMSLATGVCLFGVLYLFTGNWPGVYIFPILLLAGLVSLFWISLTLMFSLVTRYFTGAVAIILVGVTIFFTSGGLVYVRNSDGIPFFSWAFPNLYAVDPIRDLSLLHQFSANWETSLLILSAFALGSICLSLFVVVKRLRKLA